ncbi:zinc-binding dehydrogenase [Sphingomonas sp.]|uniref:zinc-binding dehydrogenase n=1 Tax=Sphingomonas sp. TaxID=28214 RepID=UPI003D6D07EB
MMKALVQSDDTERLVAFQDVDDPSPADDQLVVKVEAFSLNRPDFLYLSMPGSGWRTGIDFAGTVQQAARDGTGPRAGEKIVVHSPAGGGGAELVAVAAAQVTVIPHGIGIADAAALPLAGLVALRLIREAGPVEGRKVLITGATGGVGHATVELLIGKGALVTALASAEEPSERLAALGCTVVQVLGAADGPFDIVLESVGGATFGEIVPKLAKGATILWFGQASFQPITLDFFSFFVGRESFTLRHFVYNDLPALDDGKDIAELLELVRTGQLHAEIGQQGDWSQTAAMLDAMKNRTLRGKAVLMIG